MHFVYFSIEPSLYVAFVVSIKTHFLLSHTPFVGPNDRYEAWLPRRRVPRRRGIHLLHASHALHRRVPVGVAPLPDVWLHRTCDGVHPCGMLWLCFVYLTT